ncbi:MAG: ABC transporter ATP-binding protein [Leptospira sp.]|nr:ABC transporter ATP-binding protein [Leptospira sp.]
MILIKNLKKTIGGTEILSGINLEIDKGSIFSLIGPNGSGKTTLIKCLVGLSFPDQGSVIRLDAEGISFSEFGKFAGYMPQTPNFPAGLTVGEFLDMVTGLEENEPEYKESLLDIFEVGQFISRPLGKLSGGMKQKVNILQCFMFPKKFFIVDEPTASLDPFVANVFKNLLREKRDSGCSILFSSHILPEVREIADRVALIIEGKIQAENSMSEILGEGNSGDLQNLFRGNVHTYGKQDKRNL